MCFAGRMRSIFVCSTVSASFETNFSGGNEILDWSLEVNLSTNLFNPILVAFNGNKVRRKTRTDLVLFGTVQRILSSTECLLCFLETKLGYSHISYFLFI